VCGTEIDCPTAVRTLASESAEGEGCVDLFTLVGWTLAIWLAYKVGVYVERKMQAKAQALQTQADSKADSERKP
jgi:hypothetical protein